MEFIIGAHECRLDVKGRLMLPSGLKKQFRSVMKDGFILKKSVYQTCLELYPMKSWNEVVKNMSRLNLFVKEHADFIRVFTKGLRMVTPDNVFRLLIPKDLVEFAGLKRDAVLSSVIDKIEIWDKATYEKATRYSDREFKELADKVMGQRKEQ